MKPKVIIKLHKVKCGDCISINFEGADGKRHNILIDAGYSNTFKDTLKKEVDEIIKNGEQIDLFVVTHIHDDHISGMKRFIEVFGDKDIVKEYWFNWVPEYLQTGTELHQEGKIGIEKATTLRDFLENKGKLQDNKITSGTEYTISNVKITVLSPSIEQLDLLEGEWAKQEAEAREKQNKIAAGASDYSQTIEELVGKEFEQDESIINGSSISFLLEISGIFSGLFLADAHPTEIENSINRIIKARGVDKLTVDFVKLSHHGSKGNTSSEMLSLIDSKHYAVSSNGNNKHRIPNKEALARVVEKTREKDIILFFNYREGLDNMFTPEEQDKYGFICEFDKVVFSYPS